MVVLHSIEELATVAGPISLAVGVFDGLHLGHQAVIRHALDEAMPAGGTAVVVTFAPHPQRILRPDSAPRLLTSTRHKLRLMEAFGVTNLLIVEFTAEFSRTEPADFVLQLRNACRPLRSISVGQAWSFGRNRTGNLALLQQIGNREGILVEGTPSVEVDGVPVSSTAIRQMVESGDLATAARFLGRPFTVLGDVIHGDHVGRTLGFPTANLELHNEVLPPSGVYAVRASLDGKSHGAVANIGHRPTFHSRTGRRLLELHLFDFDRDIYGRQIEVEFSSFLRPEKKFKTPAALGRQIATDAEAARQQLAAGS